MALDQLEPLIGEWGLAVSGTGAGWPEMPPVEEQLEGGAAISSFEWMDGREFVIQRWTVPDPAPDGVAVLGRDPDNEGACLQHYFDIRGVARVYRMRFDGQLWELSREQPDFSPFDFSQRFHATLTEGGRRIEGTWEIDEDGEWRKDFELTYARRQ